LVYEIRKGEFEFEHDIQVVQLREIDCGFDSGVLVGYRTLVTWFPQGEAFAAVNGSSVKKFNITSTGEHIERGSLALSCDSETQNEAENNFYARGVVFLESGGKPPSRLIIGGCSTIPVVVGGEKIRSTT